MKKAFQLVETELQEFMGANHENCLSSKINSLYGQLTNFIPKIPGISYKLEELQTIKNKLLGAKTEEEKLKYCGSLRNKIHEIKLISEREGVL